MLIVGAKGFAKEVLEVFEQNNLTQSISFFDNINEDAPPFLYKRFPVLRTFQEVEVFFKNNGSEYCLGIGSPHARLNLVTQFEQLGGKLFSVISPFAKIGTHGNQIGDGSCIMTGTILTSDVIVGKGVLINLNCTIGHDSVIGDFCELSPGVHVSGNCIIGKNVTIGTGAVIIPGISIGDNSIVAAGAVITKEVPPKSLVAGVPGVIKKQL